MLTITSNGQPSMLNAMLKGQRSALAIFAHELREPLCSILLAAREMIENADPSIQRELCSLIERQGQYVSKLIDQALQTKGRLTDGSPLRKECFDFVSVARDAIEVVASSVRVKAQRLDTVLPVGPLCMTGDPVKVQQVLVNLLGNATKYTPPGGAIQLAVEESGSCLVITTSDNGVGMDPALLQCVFDPFQQGGVPPPSADYTGLGIGLAVVKTLVEWHGGTVSAHSEGAGTGSTFVVHLPRRCPLNITDKADRQDTFPCGERFGSWMGDA